MTDYLSIERWWELVFSAYLLVSIQATYFKELNQKLASNQESAPELSVPLNKSASSYNRHPYWELGITWKSDLNNLRLILQPFIFYCLIQPWLQVFNIPGMKRCFLELIELMNNFRAIPITFPTASIAS